MKPYWTACLVLLTTTLSSQANFGVPIEVFWTPELPGQLFLPHDADIHPGLLELFHKNPSNLEDETDLEVVFAEDLGLYNDHAYKNRQYVLKEFLMLVLRLSKTPLDQSELKTQLSLLNNTFPGLFSQLDEPFSMHSVIDQEMASILQVTLYDFLKLWIILEGGSDNVEESAERLGLTGLINNITGRTPHDTMPHYPRAPREFEALENAIADWGDAFMHAAMTANNPTEHTITDETEANRVIERALLNVDVRKHADAITHALGSILWKTRRSKL